MGTRGYNKIHRVRCQNRIDNNTHKEQNILRK